MERWHLEDETRDKKKNIVSYNAIYPIGLLCQIKQTEIDYHLSDLARYRGTFNVILVAQFTPYIVYISCLHFSENECNFILNID